MITALLVENFEPFLASWNVWCKPTECEQGYFIPLGWEDELTERNIIFEVREDLSIKQIDF